MLTVVPDDGALGFWGALREVFPQARQGRCWFHKTASVLAARPKSAHPGAKKALAQIWGAEDKDHAVAAVKVFGAAHGAKFPKAVAKITQARWRMVNAPHLVALVRARATFCNGVIAGRAGPGEEAA